MDGNSSERIYSPQDVAATFGISTAGLRRLAPSYERVYGELARDPRLGRMWTQGAVDRLSTARSAVSQGRYVSVEQALSALANGEDIEAGPAHTEETRDDLVAQLLSEIRGLREAVERQNALVEQQGERLAALESPRPDAPLTDEERRRSLTRLLPSPQNSLPVSNYLIGFILALTPELLLNASVLYIGLFPSQIDTRGFVFLITTWSSFLTAVGLALPLLFGVWVGPKRKDSLRLQYVAKLAVPLGVCSLLIRALNWGPVLVGFVFRISFLPIIIITFLSPIILVSSGVMLGTAVRRAGTHLSSDSPNWSPRRLAIVGLIGTILSPVAEVLARFILDSSG